MTMFYKNENPYVAALVFKKDVYLRMLKPGYNLVWPSETVIEYDMTKPFVPLYDLSIMLKDPELSAALEVVEVKDNEIALQYESGLFKRVLTAGRHGFWKGVIDYSFVKADLSKVEITEPVDKAVLSRSELQYYVRAISVLPNEKGVLMVDNKFVKVMEPGIYYFWKSAVPVAIMAADMRQLQMEVSGQEILTRDKAALRMNFDAQYRVKDVVRALVQNKDYEKQLYTGMQLALREYVGGYTLDELLERKEALAPFVMKAVADKAEGLGLEVLGCGIRDIILPGDMKEILNQVLIAEKKAQANTIMRREETASTRSLLNTAKLMEENEMLYKLKEMEYVERIAEKINSISVSGSDKVVDQLKQIFSPARK